MKNMFNFHASILTSALSLPTNPRYRIGTQGLSPQVREELGGEFVLRNLKKKRKGFVRGLVEVGGASERVFLAGENERVLTRVTRIA